MALNTLIFDLGGVILDLQIERTAQAFEQLGGKSFASVWTLQKQARFFEDYECGRLTTAKFVGRLRSTLNLPGASDEALVAAWNAMLVGIPSARLEALLRLREKYRVFLLSNTNALHMEFLSREILSAAQQPLDVYFDKVYVSYAMGQRKPSTKAFSVVLQENNLKPQDTLFIDDLAMNVCAAESLGIQGCVHRGGAALTDYLAV
jgi:FMN phosphatase YigB (HAD superfamily)